MTQSYRDYASGKVSQLPQYKRYVLRYFYACAAAWGQGRHGMDPCDCMKMTTVREGMKPVGQADLFCRSEV